MTVRNNAMSMMGMSMRMMYAPISDVLVQ